MTAAKGVQILQAEAEGFDWRLAMARLAVTILPSGMVGRMRASVYRAAGLKTGRGTLIAGPLTFGGLRAARLNLKIGSRCFVNHHVFIDAAAPVAIGDGVSIGHHVLIITTDHAIGTPEFRAGALQAAPVTIGDGVWIAAGATILPGVTIGAGAIVAAGAVVARDVAPDTLVGGVPARVIRSLS